MLWEQDTPDTGIPARKKNFIPSEYAEWSYEYCNFCKNLRKNTKTRLTIKLWQIQKQGPCVPDRKFLDVAPYIRFFPWTNHPWPMCPDLGRHHGKLTVSGRGSYKMFDRLRLSPWPGSIGSCPSVRCKLGLLRWGTLLCRFTQSI